MGEWRPRPPRAGPPEAAPTDEGDPPIPMCPPESRTSPATGDWPELPLAATEPRQPLGALKGDQGFQPQMDERGLFLDTRNLGRPVQGLVVDVQRRSHAYEYSRIMHTHPLASRAKRQPAFASRLLCLPTSMG